MGDRYYRDIFKVGIIHLSNVSIEKSGWVKKKYARYFADGDFKMHLHVNILCHGRI